MENDLLFCWTKLPDVCHYEGKKKTAGIKLQYVCQYGDQKKPKTTKEQS
jgi:hypothetical protein